jgi:hypothetical protein
MLESIIAREAILIAITDNSIAPANPRTGEAALALRASLSQLTMLTRDEKYVLEELLARIATGD